MVVRNPSGMPRHYSRRMGRRPTIVIKSYKKILNFLEASSAAGFRDINIATGTDGLAAGQTSNIDAGVPTGSIIKFVEVQFSITNVTVGNVYVNTSFGYTLGGQSIKDPRALGGETQRNQIIHQAQFGIGTDQNFTRTFRFRIPKQFQRLREGMKWNFVWANNESVNTQTQVIYKFYQ